MSKRESVKDKTCDFDGCNKPAMSRGSKVPGLWCSGHYQQQYQGNPMRPLFQRKDFDSWTEKGCTRCGETKAIDEFYRMGRGYQPACKECMATAQRARNREVTEALRIVRAMKANQTFEVDL